MRVVRWLWNDPSTVARAARSALLPAAVVVGAATALRAAAYRRGLLSTRSMPLPSVAVGNLSVGGSGKTPIASWIAGRYVLAGNRPAVLLRGYGRDETLLHRRLVPQAIVLPNSNRVRAARAAVAHGAEVAVLDDAFQRIDLRCDLNIVLVSVESLRSSRWILPAGPWREGWKALARAGAILITRRTAGRHARNDLARHLVRCNPAAILATAALEIACFRGLQSGTVVTRASLRGTRLLAASGIGDPESFVAQLRELGADVSALNWRDHHPYGVRDTRRLTAAADDFDHVVVTEKDAVKLQPLWPARAPEPLVAELRVRWESGLPGLLDALHRITVQKHPPIGPADASCGTHQTSS